MFSHSFELASDSASFTIVSLVEATFFCSLSKLAKWVRRRLSNLFLEDENLFHKAASTFLSKRGAFFHSSNKTLSLAVVTFQATDSTKDSASATIFSLIAAASTLRASRSAFWAAFFA